MKVLICDDEQGMRMILKKAIEKVDGFEVVGEAEDGDSLISVCESIKPQIIFLDVEMPGVSGIECAKKIMDIDPKIMIIFATAHEEFMSDAFQVYAYDYIVKPFKLERIFQTLERIKLLNNKDKDKDIDSGINNIIRHEKSLDKIIIRNKEGISFINISEIILVERENRSTVIYTAAGNYTTSEALSEIEEKLDKHYFLRSHKSYIINLSMVHKIYPYGRWTYSVELKNTNRDALLTHDKYEELKKIFGVFS